MSNFRHFKALLKKNVISWKRNVCCSIFEIMCPLLLMIVMVWVRTKISISEVKG